MTARNDRDESTAAKPQGSDSLLSEDHSAIELVPAASRDVWFKRASEIPLSKKREAAMEAVRRWRERKRDA